MKKYMFNACILAVTLGFSAFAGAQGNGKSTTNQGATPNGKPFAHLSEQLQANADAITALGTEIQEIRDAAGSITADLGELEALIILNQVAISQLQADLAATSQEVAELQDSVNTSIEDINAEIALINSQIASLQAVIGALADDLSVELAAMQAAVDANSGDISSLLVSVNLLTSQIVLIDLVLDDHEGRISALEEGLGELEQLVASLDARLIAVELGEDPDAEGLCFSLTNTPNQDLVGNEWFDACVEAAQDGGNTARVVLKDIVGNIVYDASGPIIGSWTQANITSTSTDYFTQFDWGNHDRLINLDNGDKLMITGDLSNNNGCGGSLGNGYGIVIYPNIPNYYHNPKMLVMSYLQTLNWIQPRPFSGWSLETEISWNGSSFNTCTTPVPGFMGTFEFYVY